MKLVEIIKKGFSRSKSFIKYVFFMYAVTFIFSLIFGMAFNLSLNPVKKREILYKLFEQFNFSIYNSFMHNYGDGISMLIVTMFLFACLFVFVDIFFSSALVGVMFDDSNKNKLSRFFSRGVKFYWRFFKLFFYFLLAVVIAFGIIITISSIVFSSFDESGIESDYFYTALVTAVVFGLAVSKFAIIADITKLFIVKENLKSVWQGIKKSFLFLIKRMHYLLTFYFFVIVIVSLTFGIYLLVEKSLFISNLFAVFVLFIMQQLIIWIRYFTKVLLVGFEYEYFNVEYILFNKKPEKK